MNYEKAWNELENGIKSDINILIVRSSEKKLSLTDTAILNSLGQVKESMQRIKEKYRKEEV